MAGQQLDGHADEGVVRQADHQAGLAGHGGVDGVAREASAKWVRGAFSRVDRLWPHRHNGATGTVVMSAGGRRGSGAVTEMGGEYGKERESPGRSARLRGDAL